jgi:hypothetical protein
MCLTIGLFLRKTAGFRRAARAPGPLARSVSLSQRADEHRPQRPVLLAIAPALRISSMYGGANQDFLFVLEDRALRYVDHLQTYYSVQHRHPDGQGWLEVARFATRGDAKRAMGSVVAAGHAATDELRVRRVTRPSD